MKSTNLQKVAPTRLLESEPDLGHLFKLWRMDKDQMLEMMSFHVSGGGEYDIEEAACAFLKAETAVPWQTWLQVTAAVSLSPLSYYRMAGNCKSCSI